MKQYEYVRIHVDSFFGTASEKHRAVIDEYAAKGWRYAGYIPVRVTGHGVVTDLDLIFERDC